MTGKPMFMALRKKMRANDSAMTHLTPEYFNANGACSRLEPQPKFLPPTNMTPFLALLTKSVSKLSSACLANSHGSTQIRYLPGRMTSVSMLLPNFMAGALILLFMVLSPVLLGQLFCL